MLTPDELTRAARSWMNWASEPSADVRNDMVSKGARLPIEVVRANVAEITIRACFLRREDAERVRKLRIRIDAAKRGAETRGRMRHDR